MRRFLSCVFVVPLFLLPFQLARAASEPGSSSAPAARGVPDYQGEVAREVESFLREIYRSFERHDFAPMEAALAPEFTATFFIPSQGAGPIQYDRQGLIDGLRSARDYYAGRQPKMELASFVVLARSRDEAIVSFAMHFYLAGEWRGDALAIADLRRETGAWRLTRLYESKRR